MNYSIPTTVYVLGRDPENAILVVVWFASIIGGYRITPFPRVCTGRVLCGQLRRLTKEALLFYA